MESSCAVWRRLVVLVGLAGNANGEGVPRVGAAQQERDQTPISLQKLKGAMPAVLRQSYAVGSLVSFISVSFWSQDAFSLSRL